MKALSSTFVETTKDGTFVETTKDGKVGQLLNFSNLNVGHWNFLYHKSQPKPHFAGHLSGGTN